METNETLNNQIEINSKSIRERLTLDFESRSNRKRQHIASSVNNNNNNSTLSAIWTPSNSVLLESPDIKMCKLGTPELERFIISSNSHLTPTPSLAPSSTLTLIGSSNMSNAGVNNNNNENTNNSNTVTEAQEQYAKPFVDALEKLKCQQLVTSEMNTSATSTTLTTVNPIHINTNVNTTNNNNSTSMSPAAVIINKSNSPVPSSYPITINLKTEINDDHCKQSNLIHLNNDNSNQYNNNNNSNTSPPVSPINMEDQERIKLERKRLRNRIAASKCRKRKLERISKLEDKVRLLKNENTDLASSVGKLRDHVCRLKQEYLEHVKQGCMLHTANSFN